MAVGTTIPQDGWLIFCQENGAEKSKTTFSLRKKHRTWPSGISAPGGGLMEHAQNLSVQVIPKTTSKYAQQYLQLWVPNVISRASKIVQKTLKDIKLHVAYTVFYVFLNLLPPQKINKNNMKTMLRKGWNSHLRVGPCEGNKAMLNNHGFPSVSPFRRLVFFCLSFRHTTL